MVPNAFTLDALDCDDILDCGGLNYERFLVNNNITERSLRKPSFVSRKLQKNRARRA
jgi:hypothetical protein